MKIGRWLLTGALLLLPVRMFAGNFPSPDEIKAERATLFAQADADGNGSLSPDEFKTFESLVRDKMAQRHFAHLDANGDGVVSLDELQAARMGPPGGHHHCDK